MKDYYSDVLQCKYNVSDFKSTLIPEYALKPRICDKPTFVTPVTPVRGAKRANENNTNDDTATASPGRKRLRKTKVPYA